MSSRIATSDEFGVVAEVVVIRVIVAAFAEVAKVGDFPMVGEKIGIGIDGQFRSIQLCHEGGGIGFPSEQDLASQWAGYFVGQQQDVA